MNYHAGMPIEEEELIPEPPQDVFFYVRDVEDSYGTNNRAGVELYAADEDGNQWPVVTLIPGKRMRVHPVGEALGFHSEGEYPGVKLV